MRTLAFALLSILLSTATATAGPKLTFEQVLAKANGGPKVRMARADSGIIQARADEAKATRYPRIKAMAFGTVSPKIECLDPPPLGACTRTDNQNISTNFSGVFMHGQLDLVQPIYTFGKIEHARKAARAGLDATNALVDEAAGDIAVDAARAYWGVKLSRELMYILDDGIEEIDKAIKKMNAQTGADAPTIQDKQRINILLAEAKSQRADAMAGERQALAGLRALTGIPDADVDDEPLGAVGHNLPPTATGEKRPQSRAAKLGAVAAVELANVARGSYYPDLVLVATAIWSKATGVDDPPTAFANDPFNRVTAGAVVALQWTVEPWNVKVKVNRALAEANKAKALSDLAAMGAKFDAETALAEATGAKAKLDATVEGEKAGKAWVTSVVQASAIGLVESKDFADAYLAWFGMRAKWAQAAFQWNVAVVRLRRASGEFTAGGYRP
jgi:outer membrane protein TolC